MPRFVLPAPVYLASYTEARQEYLRRGVTTHTFDDAGACDIFAKYENYRQERDLPPGRVGEARWWLVDGEDYFIGEVTLRYRLNQVLLHHGGHVGYGVRCSEWGKGYGTQLLRFATEQAQNRGMARVLVTCLDDNLASARVIEKNGFVLENKAADTLDGRPVLFRRYWKAL